MIEIREEESFDMIMESSILLRKLSGLLSRDNKRRRIIYIVYFIFSLLLLNLAIKGNVFSTACLSGILAVISLLNIVFAEKINIRNIKRNIRRNYKTVNQKYDYDFTEPKTILTKVNEGVIEIEKQNSTVRYYAKDYIGIIDSEKFYILEFKNANYIFFSKDTFENADAFNEVIKEIEKYKRNL